MIPKSIAVQMAPYIVTKGVFRPRSLLAKSIVRYRLHTRSTGSLPTFIIIGGQRCGTTALYDSLLGHPNVYPGLAKEIHFFDKHFHKGDAWYRANFPSWSSVPKKGDNPPITGEATPSYLVHPHAARRVHNLIPGAKLIVLLRNPVDRAYSHYNLLRQKGLEPLSFEDAVASEEERVGDDHARLREAEDYDASHWFHYSYVSRGIYVDQLPAWIELFPPEQLLMLQSETLFRDPTRTLGKVTEFLGLSPWNSTSWETRRTFSPERVITNQSSLSDRARAELADFYRPHNERLFQLIGEEYDWNG